MKGKVKQTLRVVLTVVAILGCLLLLTTERTEAECMRESITNVVSSSNSSSAGTYMASAAVCSKHATYQWVTIKAATCTSAGTEAYTCPVCKFAYPNRPIRTKEKLSHNYTWKTTVNATCTKDGSRVYSCTMCGDVKNRKPITAAGHNWGSWIVERNASCTAAGSKYHICSVCKTKAYESIKIQEHDKSGAIKTVQPTCTTAGYKVATCSMCGSEQGNKTPLSALEHNWVIASFVDSTCTKIGTKSFNCSRCSQTNIEEVPKKAHNYNWVTTKTATCTEKGERKYVCSCGNISKTEAIEKVAHVCKWVETRKATCAQSGLAEYICVNCKTATNWQSIQFGGEHTWNRSSATCTENRECTICGTIAQKATGHTFNWETTLEATCKKKGIRSYICSCGAVANTETIEEKEHNLAWIEYPATSCVSPGRYLLECTNSGCDYVADGRSIQYYGEHDLIIEEDQLTRCTTIIHSVCRNNCGYEDVRYVVNHGNIHGYQIARIEDTDCNIAKVWRQCPRCLMEVLDETIGVPHDFQEGECQNCHKPETSDILLVSGCEENGKKSLAFNQERESLTNKIDKTKWNVLSLNYTDTNNPALQRRIKGTRFLLYTGHGGSDSSLCIHEINDYGWGDFATGAIRGLDLSDMDFALISACYSAGKCVNTTNNFGDTEIDQDAEQKYSMDQAQNSIAYAFCKQGAKLAFGCNVPLDDGLGEAINSDLLEKYLELAEKYTGNKLQEELFNSAFEIIYHNVFYSEDSSYAEFFNTLVIFKHESNGKVSAYRLNQGRDKPLGIYKIAESEGKEETLIKQIR